MSGKNIAFVKGFSCQGITAGLKKSKRPDLMIILSDRPAKVAATFTKNVVKAEPLKLNMAHVQNGEAQAIVCNSGNANACTGEQGYTAAIAMAQQVAENFQIAMDDVVVLSTGVIGREFPVKKVLKGIDLCAGKMESTFQSGENTAEAILTTDTVSKQYFCDFTIGDSSVSIGAIAKGSGMIHPDMGTMLAFIVSDINIGKRILKRTFKEVVGKSFNMISVDGDTSTNDMAVLLCNGAAENKKIIQEESPGYLVFKEALQDACQSLAKQIVYDGEGVTKFIEYKVINVKSEKDARKIIRTISNSSLVKTAMFGHDPNWGRIIAAAGRAGVDFDPGKVNMYIGNTCLLKNGTPVSGVLNKAEQLLRERDIYVTLDINTGDDSAVGWGSDLSVEYVKFNSDYTT